MLKFRILSILLVLFTAIPNLHAQTGPGGIEASNGSSNLILWLDASEGAYTNAGTTLATDGGSIQQWNDLSGYGNHSTQTVASRKPTWQENELNGLPTVHFDGSDLIEHSIAHKPQDNDYSFILVFTGTDQNHSFLAQTDLNGTGRNNFYSTAGVQPLSTYLGGSKKNSTINYTPNTWSIAGVNIVSNGNLSSCSFVQDGANAGTRSFNLESSDGVWYTGSNKGRDGRFLNGDIAEIIMFNKLLSNAELVIIQNYLAAKFNLTLTANNHYSYAANHGADVIGIGQASDGSNHTTSQGQGILTISNPSALSNGEYLFVGHNNNAIDYTTTCDLPGIYGKQLNRVWRADQNSDVGTVDLSFDLSGLAGLGTADELTLVISSSSSFKNATVHNAGKSLVGTTLSFTGVDLAAGNYFTIAQTDILYSSGAWNNGSGAGNAPNIADTGKKVAIADNVVLSSSATCGCMSVVSGKTLFINSGITLTVEEYINNNGTIALANSASLVQTAVADDNSGSGTYTITRNTGTLVDDTRYQYWSSPVAGETMGDAFSGSNTSDFYSFDGGANWASEGSGTVMAAGVGYATTGTIGLTNSADTRSFEGDVHNGTYTVSSGAANGEFTLVGNPYPSALSASTFATDNSGQITGTLWFWDHTTYQVGGGSSGTNNAADYATWNGSGSAGNGGVSPSGNIASCQGFFVEASTGTPSIEFNNAQRVSGNNSQFFKTRTVENRNRMWLSLSNDSSDANQLLVAFVPAATDAYDNFYDGKKFKGHPRISFYSLLNGEDYAIQGLAQLRPGAEKTIKLGLDAWITGSYQIALDSLANWPATHTAYLKDNVLDSVVNLAETTSYSFTIDSIGAYKNRFELFVKHTPEEYAGQGGDSIDVPGLNTGVDEKLTQQINVYGLTQKIVVQSEEHVSAISIFDVTGKNVYQSKNVGLYQEIIIEQPGIYLVNVSTEFENTRTIKVFVK